MATMLSAGGSAPPPAGEPKDGEKTEAQEGDRDRRRRRDDDEKDRDRRRRRDEEKDGEGHDDKERRRRRDEDKDGEGHDDKERRRRRDDDDNKERRRRRDEAGEGEDKDRRRRRDEDKDGDRRRREADHEDRSSRRRRRDEEGEAKPNDADQPRERRHKDEKEREDRDDKDRRRRRDDDDKDRPRRSERDHERRREDRDRRGDRDHDRHRRSSPYADRRRREDDRGTPSKVFKKAPPPPPTYFVRVEARTHQRLTHAALNMALGDPHRQHIRHVAFSQPPTAEEDSRAQHATIEFNTMEDAKAVLERHGNRFSVCNAPARVSAWIHGAGFENLGKDYPGQSVMVFDFTTKTAHKVRAEDVLATPEIVEMAKAGLCAGGGQVNLCISQTRCQRTMEKCPFVHLCDHRLDLGEAVPEVPKFGSWKGWKKGMGAGGMKGMKGIPDREPAFNPSKVEMLWEDDVEEEVEDDFRPHYETCLLVRDVDDTGDGGPRLSEGNFKQMWSEIEGYVNAKLYRADAAQNRYGSSYGVVQFESVETAVDAMAQTFGHRLNVSFFGVEEMLQEAGARLKAQQPGSVHIE